MIANLVLRRLDRRLAALTRSRGIEYTRYADDMIFSGGPDTPKILKAVRAFVAEEGFTLNEKKTRILRRGRRQEVCGLVVNERVGIPRLWRRRLRAEVHRLATGRDGAKAAPARLRGELSCSASTPRKPGNTPASCSRCSNSDVNAVYDRRAAPPARSIR
jgi:retron-type reverse transcriptase